MKRHVPLRVVDFCLDSFVVRVFERRQADVWLTNLHTEVYLFQLLKSRFVYF